MNKPEPKNKESWERYLEEQWGRTDYYNYWSFTIKDMVKKVISETKKEMKDKVLGILGEMKPNLGGLDNHDGGHYEMGFEQALADIKTKIEKL